MIIEFGTIEEMYKQLRTKNYELRFKNIGISPRILELLKITKKKLYFQKHWQRYEQMHLLILNYQRKLLGKCRFKKLKKCLLNLNLEAY